MGLRHSHRAPWKATGTEPCVGKEDFVHVTGLVNSLPGASLPDLTAQSHTVSPAHRVVMEIYSKPTGRERHRPSSRPQRLLLTCNVFSASLGVLIPSPPHHSNRSRRKSPVSLASQTNSFFHVLRATWEKLKEEGGRRNAGGQGGLLCRCALSSLFQQGPRVLSDCYSICLTLQ